MLYFTININHKSSYKLHFFGGAKQRLPPDHRLVDSICELGPQKSVCNTQTCRRSMSPGRHTATCGSAACSPGRPSPPSCCWRMHGNPWTSARSVTISRHMLHARVHNSQSGGMAYAMPGICLAWHMPAVEGGGHPKGVGVGVSAGWHMPGILPPSFDVY